jgi:hypothetical protein
MPSVAAEAAIRWRLKIRRDQSAENQATKNAGAGFVLQKDRLEQKLTTKRSKSGDVRWIAIDVSILIKPNQFQALTPKPISL